MLFAHLKRILGFGKLHLRGPCGAEDEFLLAATAQMSAETGEAHPPLGADLRHMTRSGPVLPR